MVRSILLRGFDRQMADLIGKCLEERGVTFLYETLPNKIEKNEDKTLTVTYSSKSEQSKANFDTVLYAVGRCYTDCGYKALGMKLNENNGKIITNKEDMSSIDGIYAIGDINDGKPELTPVAIKAGVLLANRLFGKKTTLMNYENIPTTVFTPVEYGSVGLNEEAAISKYGANAINVYHTEFTPLEWSLPHKSGAYVKLICNANDNDRVIGFHIFCPNAGEITQGVAVAMNAGARKDDFDKTVGIHPVIAEIITTLTVSKKQKLEVKSTSC